LARRDAKAERKQRNISLAGSAAGGRRRIERMAAGGGRSIERIAVSSGKKISKQRRRASVNGEMAKAKISGEERKKDAT